VEVLEGVLVVVRVGVEVGRVVVVVEEDEP